MIILDAGHGGTDSGASSRDGKVREKDLNLSMVKKVAARLGGIPVLFTRTGDVTLDPKPRTTRVKEAGAKLCLSLHHNAANGTARGVEVIYSLHASAKLPKAVYAALLGTGMPGRRVFTRESEIRPGQDYYYMLRDTAPVESLIIEFGFMDNPEDLKLITDPAWQDRMAAAVADTVRAYLSPLSPPAPPAPPLPPTGDAVDIHVRGKIVKGRIEKGVTYAPVRELVETLGYQVVWDGQKIIVRE